MLVLAIFLKPILPQHRLHRRRTCVVPRIRIKREILLQAAKAWR